MAPPKGLPADVSERPDVVSANESMVDLLMERAVDLLRLEAGTRDKVVVLLDQLEQDIVAALAKIDPSGTGKSQAQKKRLAQLQKQVTDSIRSTYRTSDVLLGQEIRDVVDVEATWTASAINASVQADFADAGITRTLLSTLVSNVLVQGAPTKEWWGRQAAGLADKFSDEMRRGVALGEPNSKLIDRVRGTATQNGIMDIARNSAERLVRSSVQTAANVARESTYDQNKSLIKALQWSATLDTRTSIMCITRDGHQYGVTDHKALDDGPPWLEGAGKIHWGCRSTSIPVLKSWKDIGIDAEEVPHTTRASMDGQVAAHTNFEQWLKKQSVARQNTVLGEGKADLWRKGKITFRDLLDQNGRPLTTEELRAKSAGGAKPQPQQTAPKREFPWDEVAPPHIKSFSVAESKGTYKTAKQFGLFSKPEEAQAFAAKMLAGLPQEEPLDVTIVSPPFSGKVMLMATSASGRVTVHRKFYREDPLDDKSPLIVEHTLFELDDKYQNQGYAKKMLRSGFEQYAKSGVAEINLTANIDVGGYTWAKLGFSLDNAYSDTASIRSDLRQRLITSSIPRDDMKIIGAVIKDSSDADLMYNLALTVNSAGEKIGKSLLLGSDWYGKLNLRDAAQRARFLKEIA